jgi:hypothetical protein
VWYGPEHNSTNREITRGISVRKHGHNLYVEANDTVNHCDGYNNNLGMKVDEGGRYDSTIQGRIHFGRQQWYIMRQMIKKEN